MTINMVDDLLSLVREPTFGRLHELMERIQPEELTTMEILALVAVLEAADQRVNAPAAPVLQLIPT